MKRALFILIAAALVYGCIYPYEAALPDSAPSRIAVYGDILIGEPSRFSLSYVYPLTEDKSAMRKVFPEGEVMVENELGEVFPGTYKGGGVYECNTTGATDAARYSLHIRLADGREYRTPMTGVQQAPVIRDLSYRESGGLVSLFLSMDGADSLRFFRWDYTEDWEYHADFIPPIMFVPGLKGRDAEDPAKIYREPRPDEDYYYCWNTRDSVEPHFASTEGQSENRFQGINFLNIKCSDQRLMTLYSILVTARGMSADGYAWMVHQQSASNGTGSLFEPVPSEMPGNVLCVSDPTEAVVGYVDAVCRTTRRLYISGCYRAGYDPMSLLYYPEPDEDGNYNFDSLFASDSPVAFSGDAPSKTNVLWGPKRCVDCRWSGGTKNKPEWWPNNHK